MGKIVILDEATACKISAGEVIERPASVVKELIENSIDAGATKIDTEIVSGGIKYIKVTDNGRGFEPDDALIAFDKHATSKIMSAEDLDNIRTLGFRGEALASIAAVSEVTLKSRTAENEEGVIAVIRGGDPELCHPCGCPLGTSITVKDLFYNTPARYKFLKKDSTEAGYVADVIEKMCLDRPDISFSFTSNKNQLIRSPGNGDLVSTIYSIFGKEVSDSILKVAYRSPNGNVEISGFVGYKNAVYKTRARQYFFVNGRYVKNRFLSVALDEGVKTSVMKGYFPFAVLKIKVPPENLDVNVHPMKTEVRFSEESQVFSAIVNALRGAFTGEGEAFYENDKLTPDTVKTSQTGSYGPSRAFYDHNNNSDSISAVSSPIKPIKNDTVERNVFTSEKERQAVAEFLEALKVEKKDGEPERYDPSLFDISGAENIPSVADDAPSGSILAGEAAELFDGARIVGQIFSTFIILQKGSEVYLIDQHAAHERLMYEKIKNIIETGKYETQMLLTPISVDLTPGEYDIARGNLDIFEKLGLEIEEFGGGTLIVRAVPTILKDSDISAFVAEAVACIKEGVDKKYFTDKAVYTMACKAAIKGNHDLDISEMQSLIDELTKLKGPATCPHGRPFYITVTRQEMDRKFRR